MVWAYNLQPSLKERIWKRFEEKKTDDGRTTDNRLQIIDHRQQTTDNRRRTTDHGQQTTDHRQQTTEVYSTLQNNKPNEKRETRN